MSGRARTRRWSGLAVLAGAALMALARVGAASGPAAPPTTPLAAQPLLDEAASERDDLARRLADDQPRVALRILDERPDLAPRLQAPSPAPRPVGFGILPEIQPDAATPVPPPSEARFALPDLLAWAGKSSRRLDALEACLDSGGADAAQLLDAFEAERQNFGSLDSNVDYHEFWQPAAVRCAAFFQGRNALVADARTVVHGKADAAAIAAARERLAPGLCVYHPRERGLSWRRVSRRFLVLQVDLTTDIDDDAFLTAFSDAVTTTWNGADAMRHAHLGLELRWHRADDAVLFPDGRPPHGTAVDLAKHVASFPAGLLVVTTGATTTHVEGTALSFGPAPIHRHALAHEFGHLLGFDDEYLRGFEGSPSDANGVAFIELVPFPESLMASPDAGDVTDAMLEKLLAAGPTPRLGKRHAESVPTQVGAGGR